MKSIYKFLYEQDDTQDDNVIIGTPQSQLRTKRLSDDSIDDQIDQFILDFESRSIKNDNEELFESLKNKSLKYLFEQDEDFEEDFEEEIEEPDEEFDAEEVASEVGEEGEDESEEPDPAGSEKASDVEAVSLPVPNIDMDKFVQSVVRLTYNYESLLDLPTVIINRAKNFLLENYGEKHVRMYEDTLNTEYNFDVKKFDRQELEDDNFSGEAGSLGAGQSGGGG